MQPKHTRLLFSLSLGMNPQTRIRLSRPQMLPPPLDEGHHAHCFSCTMCMKGSST